MTPFRIIIILMSGLAIAGTSYVSYHGFGRESGDLNTSVRLGSGGVGYIGGGTRVK